MHLSPVFVLDLDMLWMFQVKILLASLYVFTPVHLLDSSSPAASTPSGITSGQTGTLDCRPPCLVRLLIFTASYSNISNLFTQQFS